MLLTLVILGAFQQEYDIQIGRVQDGKAVRHAYRMIKYD